MYVLPTIGWEKYSETVAEPRRHFLYGKDSRSFAGKPGASSKGRSIFEDHRFRRQKTKARVRLASSLRLSVVRAKAEGGRGIFFKRRAQGSEPIREWECGQQEFNIQLVRITVWRRVCYVRTNTDAWFMKRPGSQLTNQPTSHLQPNLLDHVDGPCWTTGSLPVASSQRSWHTSKNLLI